MSRYLIRLLSVLCIVSGACQVSQAQSFSIFPSVENTTALSLAEMRQQVAKATMQEKRWLGPVSGPPAATPANVAVICEDLQNGGILGVVNGIIEAAKIIGWHIQIFDANGSPSGREAAFSAAAAFKPNGVILVGIDAKKSQTQLQAFSMQTIPMVGWHVSPQAGVIANSLVAMNVSTDPLEVARITAMAAVVQSGGRAGVVIFTDSRFDIARAKANAMAHVIKECKGCRLLEIKDVAISQSAELMPGVTEELLNQYGDSWTYALAINDIYFDVATQELSKNGVSHEAIEMMSAGDGSAKAFSRIQAGAFQTATVAEPLNLHGWQLIDELNRLFARQPVSGYLFPVHLVTITNIGFDGGPQLHYDPDNAYRNAYRRIWQR